MNEALAKESAKPFEQMASIEGYLKGCARLGVNLKFMTVDLHDARELSVVPRQIFALAALARKLPSFAGPQLGNKKDRAAAKEMFDKCAAASEKRLADLEKRARKQARPPSAPPPAHATRRAAGPSRRPEGITREPRDHMDPPPPPPSHSLFASATSRRPTRGFALTHAPRRADPQERERKRIEKDMRNEEIEAERQLLKFLRDEQQKRREVKRHVTADGHGRWSRQMVTADGHGRR